jgi:predicted TIM-barrel fold metal-dependent hydrolase
MDNRTAIERMVYEEELKPWLPPHIIDCHVHVGLTEHVGPVAPERIKAHWAMEVASQQSWEQLRDNYQTLFPEQQVSVLAFGAVYREVDIERENAYVLSGALDPQNRAKALFVTRPEWDAAVIRDAIAKGFLGIKPYPDLALKDTDEISIYEFLPPAHLAALNELGGVLMLHLPRAGRLGDADNVREVLAIAEGYPSIKLILPHIGRAYCLPTAQRGLPHFADRKHVCFDISANLNADVFEFALETVGPERLLFGSDLPVTMMRGVREYVGEKYVNYTDGAYSWNVNRKSPEEEARYTYYLYEELRAMIAALRRAGLGKAAMEQICYSNSAAILEQLGATGDE